MSYRPPGCASYIDMVHVATRSYTGSALGLAAYMILSYVIKTEVTEQWNLAGWLSHG